MAKNQEKYFLPSESVQEYLDKTLDVFSSIEKSLMSAMKSKEKTNVTNKNIKVVNNEVSNNKVTNENVVNNDSSNENIINKNVTNENVTNNDNSQIINNEHIQKLDKIDDTLLTSYVDNTEQYTEIINNLSIIKDIFSSNLQDLNTLANSKEPLTQKIIEGQDVDVSEVSKKIENVNENINNLPVPVIPVDNETVEEVKKTNDLISALLPMLTDNNKDLENTTDDNTDAINKLIDLNADRLAFEKDKVRDDKLKAEESKKRSEFDSSLKGKLTKQKDDLKDKFTTGATSTIDKLVKLALIGASGTLGTLLFDVAGATSEMQDSYESMLTEAQKSSKAVDIFEKEVSGLSLQRMVGLTAVKGYSTAEQSLEKVLGVKDRQIKQIQEETGLTKEQILANENQYKQLVKTNKTLEMFTETMDGFESQLSDIDSDLDATFINLFRREEEMGNIESRMTKLVKEGKKDSLEFKDLERQRQKKAGEVFLAERGGSALSGEGLTTIEEQKQFFTQLESLMKSEQQLKEQPTSERLQNIVDVKKERIDDLGIGEEELKDLKLLVQLSKNISSGVRDKDLEKQIISKTKEQQEKLTYFGSDVFTDAFKSTELDEISNKQFEQYRNVFNETGKLATQRKIIQDDISKSFESFETPKVKIEANSMGTNNVNDGKLHVVGEEGFPEFIKGNKVLSPKNNNQKSSIEDSIANSIKNVKKEESSNNNENIENLLKEQNNLMKQLLDTMMSKSSDPMNNTVNNIIDNKKINNVLAQKKIGKNKFSTK